ncbi:hypothetical protein PENTCL1PPCAC_23304, partial [Pristionchus entomophagus]
IMSYNPVAADVEKGAKSSTTPSSVFIHRQTCQHCGKGSDHEIAPEHLHHYALTYPQYQHQTRWHAVHSQSLHYTMNVMLVAIVIFLTFIAAKFLFGK